VEGECHPNTGVVMDYGDIKKVVKPLIELLDHRLINDVGTEMNEPLLMNPTSENIAKWFYDRLRPDLPMLSAVIVYETCTSTCIYKP
jgi:6-pyruvoyltetrahydropterin/6-carboxytetrahydropterin synthase